MGTDKIKLQAYVQLELYQLFLSWKQERGIESNSLAFDELLGEYFGKPQAKPEPLLDEEKIREVVESMIAEKLSEYEEFWQALNSPPEEMKRAIASLQAQVNDNESSITRLCNDLSEIKDKLGNLPGNPVDDAELISDEPRSPSNSHINNEELPNLRSGKQLAERLNVNPATLIKNRGKTNFESWTQEKDPAGLRWRYAPDLKKYEPSPR